MRKGIFVLLAATVLAGFGHVVRAADSDRTDLRPEVARRVLELKKQVLRISSGKISTVPMLISRCCVTACEVVSCRQK